MDIVVGLDIAKSPNLTLLPLLEDRIQCVLSEALLQRFFSDDWRDMLKCFAEQGVDLARLRELPMLLPPDSNRIRGTVDRLFNKRCKCDFERRGSARGFGENSQICKREQLK